MSSRLREISYSLGCVCSVLATFPLGFPFGPMRLYLSIHYELIKLHGEAPYLFYTMRQILSNIFSIIFWATCLCNSHAPGHGDLLNPPAFNILLRFHDVSKLMEKEIPRCSTDHACTGDEIYFPRVASQSASLKPTRTKSSPTRIGRFTSMPSVASSTSCSSSLMFGILVLSFMSL